MSRLDLRSPAAVWLLLGLAAAVAPVAQGQSLDAVAARTRIRIDLPGAEPSLLGRERMQSLVGTVEAVRADTLLLVVRGAATPLRIPRASVRAAFVSGGRPARWRAAVDGAVLPAAIAAVLSAAGASIHHKRGDPSAGQMAASSAAWAAAWGALFGAWAPKERWHRLQIVVAGTPD